MASLKDIRNRIVSVKNTKQITRAMKMVAAAKLRRAQEAILTARPYAYKLYSILLSLAQAKDVNHPLLAAPAEEKRVRVVVLAGDRGLCGAFNSSIFKEATKFLNKKKAEGVEVTVDCIGKKSYDFFKKRATVKTFHEGLLGGTTYTKVSLVAEQILKDFLAGEFDAAYLIYNEFKSAIQQTVTVEKLIPISKEIPDGVAGMQANAEKNKFQDYILEPSQEEILNDIVPRHFKTQMFRAVLESVASEHGARMSAMENATSNASDMIDSLTLQYNKARQAAITKELMEIVGGVEAMR